MQEKQLSLSSSLCSYFPQNRKHCAHHNFDTLRYILKMFCRNEEEDQKACHVQERLLSLFYYIVISPEAEIMQVIAPILFVII